MVPAVSAATYPRDLEQEVVLPNGTRVHVRPIRPDDAPRLVEAYSHLSAESAYQRFFSVMRRLPPDWARFLATVDYQRRLALVAETPAADGLALIAVARYEPSHDEAAEVAFVVLDGWQNMGLGTILFRALLAAGRARGITRFRAWVLADNRRMLDMIARLAHVERRAQDQNVIELVFAEQEDESAPRSAHHEHRGR